MPRKLPSQKMIYIVCSEIMDWEGGEWSSEVPFVTRFAIHDDAIAAFHRNQETLDAQAQEGAAKVREGVKHGDLAGFGGFTVRNLLFGVPSERLRRLGDARTGDVHEYELSQLADDLPEYVLESGCYHFNYERDERYEADEVLENFDPECLLDDIENPAR